MATGSYLSIITLNINGLNAQPRDKDWLNGYKNKTPINVVYKRPTSKQGTSLMLPCVLALYSWNVTLVLFKAVIPANGTMSGTAWCIWCLLNDWNTNQLVRFWGLYNTFHRPKPFPAVFQFSHSFVSHSLRPHGLQHDRLPSPSPTPRACPNSCPLSRWCHPTNSSSAVPFSCRQSFPDFQHFPAVFRLNLNAAFKMITSGFPFNYIRNDN